MSNGAKPKVTRELRRMEGCGSGEAAAARVLGRERPSWVTERNRRCRGSYEGWRAAGAAKQRQQT